jgi:hypothetical protein
MMVNNMLKPIGYFILGVLLFLTAMIAASVDSPCSAWAAHPSECSSDILQRMGN